MVKRQTVQNRRATKTMEILHICDECKHAKWVETHQNKDWQGKYICLTCPLEKWQFVRGRKACANFEPKPKEIQQ